MESELLIFRQTQPRITTYQFLQCKLRFELTEMGAEAVMGPKSERKVLARIGTSRVELLRLLEDRPVSPGGREP